MAPLAGSTALSLCTLYQLCRLDNSMCPRSSLAHGFMATGEWAEIFKCCHKFSFGQRSWFLLGNSRTFMLSFWSHYCVPFALFGVVVFPENKSSPKSKFSFRLQDLAAFSCIYFTLYPHTAYRVCCEEASQQHEPHNARFRVDDGEFLLVYAVWITPTHRLR